MRAEPSRDAGESKAGPSDTAAVLREIARPRLAGSEGAAETAAAIRSRLEGSGYDVEERPFTFNPWPGRFGLTVVGALYLIGTVAAAALMYAGQPVPAVIVLLALLAVVGVAGWAAVRLIDGLAWGSQQGSNLFATVPDGRPRFVIMAHRDSKSQLVPLALRGPAIIVALLAWIGLLGAAVVQLAEPVSGTMITVLGAVAALAGIILILCWADDKSPGALDNASGVAAALGIAGRERAQGDVAVLITDAEELGLAGARAAAGGLPRVFGVINLDGLDDSGDFYIFERFGTLRKTGLAPHMAAALLQEAESMGTPADRRDMPFGIPVDHMPIVRAGLPALTIMRGSTRSLRRVHRPGDDLQHLRGDGVDLTVDLVCGALERMREQARPLER